MVEFGIRFSFSRFLAGGSLALFSLLLVLGEDEKEIITLPAGETREQVFLDGEPERVHIDAGGVVVLSGESEHFAISPRFLLYSAALHDSENGVGYPSTEILESMELPNEEIYPVQIRQKTDPAITGLTVIGQQSRELPWRVMKSMWDGDALHVKHCQGHLEVSRVFWDNVEDGLGPLEGLESWSIRDSAMRYIRDDAIENDDLIPGEIVNCLIDGCFTFLSQRAEPPRRVGIVTSIRDSLIHVQAQPHDGIPGKQWRDRQIRMGEDGIGRAPGMLFKWERGAGEVNMRDCVVLVDEVSVNGEGDMEFPQGNYANVVLVWKGRGRYPRPLPEGVRLATDRQVWEEARAAWIDRLDPGHPAAKYLKRTADSE